MGKSFDGLSAIVQAEMKQEPCGSGLFVFFNRPANKVKILYYDRTGFAIWYKRLEKGKFRLPNIQSDTYQLSISDFNLLLEGIDLVDAKRLAAV